MGRALGTLPPEEGLKDALTGLTAARRGLYVHFPWCLKKCPYCDFAVTVAKRIPEAGYSRALLVELSLRLQATPSWREAPLDSVYLGGGTPSLWAPKGVATLLHAVQKTLGLRPRAEVTLEANPEVADESRLAGYLHAGVNRLSLGVQSFDAAILRTLGRAHTPQVARRAVQAALRAGFHNVSVDLMLGVPGQTLASSVEDARAAVALGVHHVSAYVLTVEPDALAEETVFARRRRQGKLLLPADGLVADMVEAVADVLMAAGLRRYEVSNYAVEGRHSRHNALYWTGGEYLALGPGATGFHRTPTGGVRTASHRSPGRWREAVESGQLPEAEREELGPAELFRERLMLGLRLTSGLDVEALTQRSHEASRRERLLELAAQGLGEETKEGRFRLTRRGLLLHSDVCARLL